VTVHLPIILAKSRFTNSCALLKCYRVARGLLHLEAFRGHNLQGHIPDLERGQDADFACGNRLPT